MTSVNDEAQTRLAVAALAACVLRTLGDSVPGLRPKFENSIATAMAVLRKEHPESSAALETLSWARDLVRIL